MRKLVAFLGIWILLFSTGCSSDKDELQHELDSILSTVQTHEREITASEIELRDIERKEQSTLQKTLELDIEDREPLENNVSRLQKYLEQRESLIYEEQDAIQAAEEALVELKTLPSAKSVKSDQAVTKLSTALEKRYKLHNEVISSYKELVERQRNVYNLLVVENVKRVDLEQAVSLLNVQQSKVADSVLAFNQSTNEVNSALAETQELNDE